MKKKLLTVLSIILLVSFTGLKARQQKKNILFFGNSLTAGFGLDPELAFPNLIQQKIDEKNTNYTVINAGLSGETSAGGLSRIDWVMSQPIDIFILELGANDGLRGLPLESTRNNLQGILDKVKQKYPNVKIVIAGMMVPPNMGETYSNEFIKIYPELAGKNNAVLIPFLLDGVAGNPDLNLPDGIHPNVEGQQIVAENIWSVLKPIL
ncbi:MAG: arylesterase [Cyclobacteriaceae bacterium]|nr:arylesterase [Cyclobacteriaceae bacterium]